MKHFIAAISATLFTAAVCAAGDSDIYHGFAQGNPDLSAGDLSGSVSAVRPGTGDSFSHYQGLRSPDLFTDTRGGASASSHPDIYQGFSGNPDLW